MKRFALVAGVFSVLGNTSSQAADATWTSATSGQFTSAGNWGAATPVSGHTATFSTVSSGTNPITVTVDGALVKGITFDGNANPYTFTASGNQWLTMDSGALIQTTGQGAYSQTFLTSIALNNGATTITSNYTDASKVLVLSGSLSNRNNQGIAVVTLNGSNKGANTVSGSIINAPYNIAVVKNGSGNWILSGTNNSYTGTTTISEGGLMVTGTYTGGGAYTINGTGVLGGAGGKITTSSITLSGSTAGINVSGAGLGTVGSYNGVTSTGTLELALGAGSLDISQAGAGSLTFALATPGTSDHVWLSSGTLNIGNGVLSLDNFTLDISQWAVTGAEGTYTLFTSASPTSITGQLASTGLTRTFENYQVELILGNTDSGAAALQLNVTAIPEPATIHILGLGLLAGAAAVLRRKKKS